MKERFDLLSRLAAGTVALIGVLVMAGWLYHVPALTRFVPGLMSMAFNTAAAFALVGVALALVGPAQPPQRWQRFFLAGCGVLIFLLGTLVVAEYALDRSLGVDQLLHPQLPWPAPGTAAGRIAPVSAIVFAVLGLALMVFHSRRLAWIGQYLAAIVGFLGLLGVIGYAYDVRALYQVRPYGVMALHTAAGFCLIALAYLCARPNLGWMAIVASDSPSGTLARRLLPMTILVPALLGWLRLLGQAHGYYSTGFGTALLCLAMIALFTTAVLASLRKLQALDAERRAASARLQSETTFSDAAINSLPGLFVLIDAEQRLVRWNANVEQVTGYTGAELVRMRALDFVTPEDRPLAGERISQAFAYGEAAAEIHLMAKDGRRIPFAFTGRRFELENRAGVVGVGLDITKRHQAEEALRRQAALIDLCPDAIIVRTVEGTITFWSKGAETLYGWTKAEALGARTHALLQSELPVPLETILDQLHAIGHWSGDFRQRRRDRTWITVHSHWSIHTSNTGVDFLLESNTDVTERKQAEEELRRALGLIEGIAQGTDDLIAAEDDGFRYLYFNDAYRREFQRLWGRDIEVGRSMLEAMAPWPEEQGKAHALWSRALQGESFRVTLEFGPSDQARQVYDLRFNPIRDAQGRLMGAAHILRNVTEQVRLEGALAEMNANLERLVQERTAKLQETVDELEHFSYTITHDMRAPLRAMRGFGAILLSECGDSLNATRQDLLRRIADSAERMDHLITDALKFSRAVQTHPELKPVQPAPLLRGIVESYPQLQPPHAEIQVDEPMAWVLGNEAGMTQCFSNLLDNAVKFVSQGLTPRVRVWATWPSSPGQRVRLWFEDNGIGIRSEHQDRIFGMFQQLDRSYAGTGIGLALVRKVVRRMGGDVGVLSAPGQGSRFWLELQSAEQTVCAATRSAVG